MFEKIEMVIIGLSVISLALLYLLRKQFPIQKNEKIIRIIVTAQFILGAIHLAQTPTDIKIKLIFLGTWCASLFVIWKRPLFCRECKSFLSIGLWPRHCSKCGFEISESVSKGAAQ
jgi:hypothetical protein